MNRAFSELSCPQADQTTPWLNKSWFVSKLSSYYLGFYTLTTVMVTVQTSSATTDLLLT